MIFYLTFINKLVGCNIEGGSRSNLGVLPAQQFMSLRLGRRHDDRQSGVLRPFVFRLGRPPALPPGGCDRLMLRLHGLPRAICCQS